MMTAKEYLSQIHSINIRLKSMARQKQSLEDSLMNFAPVFSDMPRPASPDIQRMETLIAAKVDIENEMAEASSKLVEIHKTIGKIRNAELNALLTARYIDRKKWGVIASELYISLRQVHRLHQEVLAEIDFQLKDVTH